MGEYRTTDVANLAAQLRRTPRRLRLRQLLNIEHLLSILDSRTSYPSDFLLHGVTGFRPRGGAIAGELIGGESARADLVTLADELSADADIRAAMWPERIHSVAELAERFRVSTKTIFRWHRRGLVGWRFRYEDRRVRLAFPERCVRRFVFENARLVQRGGSFSQLSAAERATIIERARVLVDSEDGTVNAVAKIVSGESGRAVETIRLILKQYDDAHPKAGLFNRSSLRIDGNDQRLQIWEAHVEGASIESLSRRFERTIAQIYATITEMRARELKTRALEFVPSDEFTLDNADELIFECSAVRSPFGAVTRASRIPRDLPSYLAQLFRIPLLTAEGEAALFRKMNYLKFKADVARQAIDPEAVEPRALDQIDALLADAEEVKRTIVQSNLRLVVSIAKRHITPAEDFWEKVSDGNISLMRAVDRFDYSRGFKFSTYGSWAIVKNYARALPDQRRHRDRYQTGRDEMLESVAGPPIEEFEDDYLIAVRSKIEGMLDVLDEREQEILRQRYGLDSGGQAHTLEQIGRNFGVSKERIRQLEARAMQRLRGDFADQASALLNT